MRRSLNFVLFSFGSLFSSGQKNNVIDYTLPDSVKAISFLADISVSPITTKKEVIIGIKTDAVKLSLESDKKEREVVFEFPSGAQVMTTGIGTNKEKDELSWSYQWAEKENYKLMIATAGDSAGNFSLYSGYIFLPKEGKWKLIGTCKINGQWNTIKQPAVFTSKLKNANLQVNATEVWCQRQNGSWKNMQQTILIPPIVNLFSHVDSLEQLKIDLAKLNKPGGSLTQKQINNVYYEILKEGSGKQVSVNDTVTVNYKGSLFENGQVFDETKEKPATFPLRRLITGWQIGVPLCKVGGKIRIIIPSNLAYSIRTRAARIPPNSILVFDIEVTDAKSPN
jgi:FKBP-type peptidyl-prolyl cis-trans isomerase FkpA